MVKEIYLFFAFVTLLNVVSFILFYWDRRLQHRHRHSAGIPSHILITVALLGGALGELASMLVFHHKWHNLGYVITLPILVLVQAVLLYFLICGYMSTVVDGEAVQHIIPA